MNSSLKIRRLLFNENGIMFVIERQGDSEYFHCLVAELYRHDQMLAEFNAGDIRLICYFAIAEEFERDRNFLKKLPKS